MSVRPDSDQCWHKLLIMDERQRTDSRSGKISHGRWLLVSLRCHAVLHHKTRARICGKLAHQCMTIESQPMV